MPVSAIPLYLALMTSLLALGFVIRFVFLRYRELWTKQVATRTWMSVSWVHCPGQLLVCWSLACPSKTASGLQQRLLQSWMAASRSPICGNKICMENQKNWDQGFKNELIRRLQPQSQSLGLPNIYSKILTVSWSQIWISLSSLFFPFFNLRSWFKLCITFRNCCCHFSCVP